MNLPPRRGLALTVIGAVLMLIVAPLVVGVTIWTGTGLAGRQIDSRPWMHSGDVLHLAHAEGEVILVKDESVDCTVTGPSGQVPLRNAKDTALNVNRYKEYADFWASTPGDYRVDCTAPVKVVPVMDKRHADDTFYLTLLIGLAVAALAFVIGVVLAIVGVTKLVGSRRERRLAQAAQGGYHQPPHIQL